MADISKITLPNGQNYNIKDPTARSDIIEIKSNYATKIESQNHVIASKTQPTDQQVGDIWLVLS